MDVWAWAVVLFGLKHLGVWGPAGVFRRDRCLYDLGIHSRALKQTKPLAQEILVNKGEDFPRELVGLKQLAEFRLVVSAGLEPLPKENPANRRMEAIP